MAGEPCLSVFTNSHTKVTAALSQYCLDILSMEVEFRTRLLTLNAHCAKLHPKQPMCKAKSWLHWLKRVLHKGWQQTTETAEAYVDTGNFKHCRSHSMDLADFTGTTWQELLTSFICPGAFVERYYKDGWTRMGCLPLKWKVTRL